MPDQPPAPAHEPNDAALPDLHPLPGKQTGAEVTKLVGLMQRLLAPDGCPWDREQTLETLIPYLIEETYEVIDALHEGTVEDHREELGDLLLQVVFQAELRHAEGKFGIDDVARGIVAKLVHRHPHVFGEVKAENTAQALASWAKLKAEEKAAKAAKAAEAAKAAGDGGAEAGAKPPPSALDGIPKSAPALVRAFRAGEKAAGVGFDWPDAAGPRDKITEELAELDQACAGGDRAAMTRELGDLLFATVNLARKLGLDAESALRECTARFARRFASMEQAAGARGQALRELDLDEQNRLWDAAKAGEARGR
jgi:MazG family protein